MIMAPVLRCKKCGEWYTVQRVVPDVCPNCSQSALWSTETDTPRFWTPLNHNDLRLLKAFRIQPFNYDD